MYYEIYDTETRNLLLDTQTLTEALTIVRATIAKHGSAAIATWMLVEDDEADSESGRSIATGEALVRLATKPQMAAPQHD
jgi:hypothetical protein